MANLLKQFLTVLVTIVIFGTYNNVYAADKGTITIEPSLVDVTLEAASSEANIVFTLTNNGDKQITLEIFPLDFKQKDELGRIALLQENAGSYSYSLSSFLQFDTNTLELLPGEKKRVTATALNRMDLSPGGHYAAVIARLVPEGKETAISPAVSSLVLLRKTGGERFSLFLKDVEWPKGSISFTYKRYIRMLFQNEGNIHLVPYGRVEIKDMFGRLLYKGVINSPSDKIFPESRRYISVEMKKIAESLPFSFNTFTIRGNDSLKEVTFQYDTSFVYISPTLLFLIIGIPALFVVVRLRRKKQ